MSRHNRWGSGRGRIVALVLLAAGPVAAVGGVAGAAGSGGVLGVGGWAGGVGVGAQGVVALNVVGQGWETSQAGERRVVPGIISSRGEDLAASREKARAGVEPYAGVMKQMVADAEKAMSVGPFSVVNKKKLPPSGDKHDYASLSPYWWPDPSKPDGVPYIRRDGQFNPERQEYDLAPLEAFADAVDDLATGYFMTGDEKYAERAVLLMRVWFLDPATRMNPNLTYAQFVPGYTEPRFSGILEGGRLRKVVDGMLLLEGSKALTPQDSAGVREWFGKLKTYILTAPQGMGELGTGNNHATWAHVQVGTYMLLLGETEEAGKLLGEGFRKLVDHQLAADGSQPEELVRTMSYHYSRFNLQALVEVAALAERAGVDVWGYKNPKGAGLKEAADFLLPYALGEKEWKKDDLRGVRAGEMVVVLRRLANATGDRKYEDAARKIQEKDRRELVDFLFPSKFK